MTPSHLRGPIVLSIAAAVVTIGMKATSYAVTGSVGLFADALESGVNLMAAVTAYFSLWYAARPEDVNHAYGHEKIEHFSSGLEGLLVMLAGAGTAWFAAARLVAPRPLDALGAGVAITAVATAINFVVARVLLRAARTHDSIVLEADGQHLMADVWTSAGVVAGVGLAAVTGWPAFDPLVALAVGLHIVHTGGSLVRRSFNGLMDHALPADVLDEIRRVIRDHLPPGAAFHALRTRQAGSRPVADFHLLVPGRSLVRDAHALAHRVEDGLKGRFPLMEVVVHIEPVDEEGSWEPEHLQRLGEGGPP